MVSGGNGSSQTVPAAGGETARRHISPLAEEEIRDMRAKGLKPSDDEIVWINDICRRIERPVIPSPIATGLPVLIPPNIWLWPFTLQAAAWYQWALDYGFDQTAIGPLALAYAFNHSREEGAFLKMYDAPEARRVILEWRKTLACSEAELSEGILAMINQDVDYPEDPAKSTVPDFLKEQENAKLDSDRYIAKIIAACGGTAEYWSTKVSMKYLITQKRAADRAALAGSDSGKVLDEIEDLTRDLTAAIGVIEKILTMRKDAEAKV